MQTFPFQLNMQLICAVRETTGSYYAVFQGTSNGGRQFLRIRWSNRHIVYCTIVWQI